MVDHRTCPKRLLRPLQTLLTTAFLILSVSPAFADHERFTVGAMQNADPSTDGVTSISGSCIPTHNRDRLDCYFTSFLLTREKSDEVLKKESDEFLQAISQDPAKQISEIKKTFCADEKLLKPDPIRIKYNVWFRAFVTGLQKFCGRPTRESAVEFIRAMQENQAKECRCTVGDWRAAFTRQVDRWVSNSGPEGLCGVVTVSTLTPHDPKKMSEPIGPILWRLDERTVVTRPDAELCKLLKVNDRSISLSWDAPSKSVDCGEMRFSSALDGMSNPRRR